METEKIDITGLDVAEVVAALYNASSPQGMGWLQADSNDMTIEEAREICEEILEENKSRWSEKDTIYLDYVKGRPLKVSIKDNCFNPMGFDRDNGGTGAAQKVIDRLKGNPVEEVSWEKYLSICKAKAIEIVNSGDSEEGLQFFMRMYPLHPSGNRKTIEILAQFALLDGTLRDRDRLISWINGFN